MTETKPTVFIVDDDEAMRDSLMLLLQAEGLPATVFASADAFLDVYRIGTPGCVIADVRMPGLTGIELMDRLHAAGAAIPVILITGHGDIPMAVSALKRGAADFFEKPFDDNLLLARIRETLAVDDSERQRQAQRQTLRARLANLTPREREIMEILVEGQPNKVIAAQLAISPRTVEVHRARIMEKMQARNLSDLVRMALQLGTA
jgi:two-component system, LuxR family, response regulator FixJ